jgi:serpin B
MNFTACTVKAQAANLLDDITANEVKLKPVDEAFISSSADFALNVFKKSIKENENSLISPLSVMLALSMVANGANGQTKSEMEELLGGNITLDDLNEYLYTYVKNLPSDKKYKLKIANSIWFRDDEDQLTIEKDFLQANANYYNAATYKSAFDKKTVNEINDWVKKNTDGMIDKILNEIDKNAVIYLINALAFDAEWDTVYEKYSVNDGTFHALNGSIRSVEMMYSGETQYIDTGKATGFIKNYKDRKYSFVALLPNEGIDINEYIASLTGESFMLAVSNVEHAIVSAQLPKFSYEYSIKMNDVLSSLGMPTAFNADLADFSNLGNSTNGNIFIGNVIHKTFISVDELGTKAGAVTKVEVNASGAPPTEIKYVKLDRPFIYAIIDNTTKLPFFIGTVMDIQK